MLIFSDQPIICGPNIKLSRRIWVPKRDILIFSNRNAYRMYMLLTTLRNAQCIHPSAGGQLIILGKTDVELRGKYMLSKD